MGVMAEQWRPVGETNRYQVSDQGRVYDLKKDCLTPLYLNTKKTHHCVTIESKMRLVHHLVLEAFVGPRPEGTEACHANDVGTDNRLENLRWDTRSANVLDSVRNGTHVQASKTHCPQNHEYTPENTGYGTNGKGTYRRCKTCDREYNRRRRAA